MGMSVGWPGVAVAVAVGMAIAWVWYSDWGLFGPAWRGLTGVSARDSQRSGRRPFVVLLASILVTALALAAACAVVSGFTGIESPWIGPAVGLAAWLGLSLSTLAQHNAFEQKPVRLTVINGGYQLVLFSGMGLAIGLMP